MTQDPKQPSYEDFQRDYWAPDRDQVLASMNPNAQAPKSDPGQPPSGGTIGGGYQPPTGGISGTIGYNSPPGNGLGQGPKPMDGSTIPTSGAIGGGVYRPAPPVTSIGAGNAVIRSPYAQPMMNAALGAIGQQRSGVVSQSLPAAIRAMLMQKLGY